MSLINELMAGQVARNERADELRGLIAGLKNEVKCIVSDLDDDPSKTTGYERRLADLDRRIALLLKQRARMVERHERGYELIAQYTARIEELQKELATLSVGNQLLAIIKLHQQINSIQSEVSPAVLAANLGLIAESGSDEDE